MFLVAYVPHSRFYGQGVLSVLIQFSIPNHDVLLNLKWSRRTCVTVCLEGDGRPILPVSPAICVVKCLSRSSLPSMAFERSGLLHLAR